MLSRTVSSQISFAISIFTMVILQSSSSMNRVGMLTRSYRIFQPTSPLAIKCNVGFLKENSFKDPHAAKELSKFSIVPIKTMDFKNIHAAEASSSKAQNSNHTQSMPDSAHVYCQPSLQEVIKVNKINDHGVSGINDEDLNEKFITVGSFQFRVNAMYPSPPLCFLTSAPRYAPPVTTWPPILSHNHQ